MANVDGEKPILRGLTPPRLPPAATPVALEARRTAGQGSGESAQAAPHEALPIELTPVLTVEQSAALTAERAHAEEDDAAVPVKVEPAVAALTSPGVPVQTTPAIPVQSELAVPVEVDLGELDLAGAGSVPAGRAPDDGTRPDLADETTAQVDVLAAVSGAAAKGDEVAAAFSFGSEDRTIIAPTPIPPEPDDYTNPTADAQILDSAPVHPAVPVRAAALGMSAIAARGQSQGLGQKVAQLSRRPVALPAVQLALLLLGGVALGGVVTALVSSKSPAPAPAVATPAAPAPPRLAPEAPAVTAPPEAPMPAPPKPAVAAAEPEPAKAVARKRKPAKKLGGARLANSGKTPR